MESLPLNCSVFELLFFITMAVLSKTALKKTKLTELQRKCLRMQTEAEGEKKNLLPRCIAILIFPSLLPVGLQVTSSGKIRSIWPTKLSHQIRSRSWVHRWNNLRNRKQYPGNRPQILGKIQKLVLCADYPGDFGFHHQPCWSYGSGGVSYWPKFVCPTFRGRLTRISKRTPEEHNHSKQYPKCAYSTSPQATPLTTEQRSSTPQPS